MLSSKANYLSLNICSVAYCLLADLISYTEKPNQEVEITVNSWREIYNTIGTANFIQPMQNTPNGPLYAQQVSLSIPGLAQQQFHNLLPLHNGKFIVRITFANNDQYIVGNPYTQAKADYNFNTQNSTTLINFALSDVLPAHKIYQETTPPIPGQGIGSMQIGTTFIVG